MYLVMRENRGTSIYGLFNKEVRGWKTICMCEGGSEDKKKVKRNPVRERRGKSTACTGHAMRSTDKHLCNLGRGKSASIPWMACDSCYVQRPNFTLYLLLNFSPATCQWERKRKWMNERKRQKSQALGLLLNSRGESERKRERERCRQERKWNLNGPIQLVEPHREFTWGQSHALFVSPWRRASWVCASVQTDSSPASKSCYWFPHNFPDQISGKS